MKATIISFLVGAVSGFTSNYVAKYGAKVSGMVSKMPGDGGKNFTLTVDGKTASYWHDIPMTEGGEHMVNIVVEIPRGTCGKYEMYTKSYHNPILQDTKNDQLRFYAKGPVTHNYGMIPQTWESAYEPDPYTGLAGDKDPIDIFEIGAHTLPVGGPYKAKVLGIAGMVDDGETDWKVITVSESAPEYTEWNDISDVDGDLLEEIIVWLQTYKSTNCKRSDYFEAFLSSGQCDAGMYKPLEECEVEESEVTFEDFTSSPNVAPNHKFYMDKNGAMEVLVGSHEFWKKLVSGGYANQEGSEKYYIAA